MKIVRLRQQVTLPVGPAKHPYTFYPDVPYVILNREARTANTPDLFLSVEDLDDSVSPYAGQDLTGRSLLCVFFGRYGDALMLAQSLNALRTKYPTATIDLAVHGDVFELMEAFGFRGCRQVGWPLTQADFRSYEYFFSAECVESVFDLHRRNMTLAFADAMGVQLPDTERHPRNLDSGSSDSPWQIPYGNVKKRVGIQVSASKSNKFYPPQLLARLLKEFRTRGFEVFLLGDSGDVPDICADQGIHSMVGKTPGIVDFAQVLSQMDLLLGPDSVGAHIGGLLSIPTCVLLSVTSPANFSHYSSVSCLPSSADCAPCYALNHCPLGKPDCLAMHHESMRPEVVLPWILSRADT